MNILYIDDNIQDLNLVTRYIDTTPHEIIAVKHVNEVNLKSISVDLVLLDILLEGKTAGFDCLKTLRDHEIHCPVVAVTALTLPHQIASYESAGIDAVFSKPFEITQLAELIARYES